MRRIIKDKNFQRHFGSMVTLNQDHLSGQFEEEWSTPVHKVQFSEWMDREVLCGTGGSGYTATLTHTQVKVMVGALLCPSISQVLFCWWDCVSIINLKKYLCRRPAILCIFFKLTQIQQNSIFGQTADLLCLRCFRFGVIPSICFIWGSMNLGHYLTKNRLQNSRFTFLKIVI